MEDLESVKRNIAIFLVSVCISKCVYLASLYLKDITEPYLNEFLTREFVQAIFTEYEAEYRPIEVAIVLDKIKMVKKALTDCIYYLTAVYLPSLISLTLALFRIFIVSYKLGAVAFFGFATLIITVIFLPVPEPTISERDNLFDIMEDVFTNIEYIKTSTNGENQAIDDIQKKNDAYADKKIEYTNKVTLNQTIIFLMSLFMYVVCVIYLYILYRDKEISMRDFEATVLMIAQMFRLIFDITESIPECVGDFQNMFELENYTKKLFSYKRKNTNDDNVSIEKGLIEFRQVSFSFDNNVILKDFSLSIPDDKMVALYGPSGSGKSTFVKLIIDMYQPKEGMIFLDGHALNMLSKAKIRNYISYTSQNTTSLMKRTVYENIIYGINDTEENLKHRVADIVREYEIHKIFHMDNFLDLKVQKVGSSLSGGQKQIIHLIHSLLNSSSKIIVLDEPTSALDSETRKRVIRLIRGARDQGKMILVITHDVELRDACDIVLNFTSGNNPVIS